MTGADVEPVAIDMIGKPTASELLELSARGSRVPLDEIRAHPHGALFPAGEIRVAPRDDGCTDRLDVGNEQMMLALGAAAEGAVKVDVETSVQFPFRLVCRRAPQSVNSSHIPPNGGRARPLNPAHMHPDDLERLGLAEGDRAVIRSSRSSTTAIVTADNDVRAGTVSMSHGWGGPPDRDLQPDEHGSSVNRLVHAIRDLDPFSGQPLTSNLPVDVRAP
jgi:anaerobic selenocysteine-containing dehydrogenase